MGLLDHMVVLLLILGGTSILFSIVAPLVYPTESAQGFPFIYFFTNAYWLFFLCFPAFYLIDLCLSFYYFLLHCLGLVCTSFSPFLMWKLRLLVWELSFLMQAFNAIISLTTLWQHFMLLIYYCVFTVIQFKILFFDL